MLDNKSVYAEQGRRAALDVALTEFLAGALPCPVKMASLAAAYKQCVDVHNRLVPLLLKARTRTFQLLACLQPMEIEPFVEFANDTLKDTRVLEIGGGEEKMTEQSMCITTLATAVQNTLKCMFALQEKTPDTTADFRNVIHAAMDSVIETVRHGLVLNKALNAAVYEHDLKDLVFKFDQDLHGAVNAYQAQLHELGKKMLDGLKNNLAREQESLVLVAGGKPARASWRDGIDESLTGDELIEKLKAALASLKVEDTATAMTKTVQAHII
jgi:hypothetical protein